MARILYRVRVRVRVIPSVDGTEYNPRCEPSSAYPLISIGTTPPLHMVPNITLALIMTLTVSIPLGQ